MDSYRFKRMAKEQDAYDPATMFYEPLFLEEDIGF